MTDDVKRIAEGSLGHHEAIEAIVRASTTVTLLSYREAIEGYLKLRGMEDALDSRFDCDSYPHPSTPRWRWCRMTKTGWWVVIARLGQVPQ